MKEPSRVLHVLGSTNLGGAESRVMDLYRHIDRERMQFDFVVHTQDKGFFEEEIRLLGGRIYPLPKFKVYNWFSYQRAWKQFFKEHPGYAAVHGHMTSTASIYLPIAKKNGVPITVAHARSAGTDAGIKGSLTRLIRKNLWKHTDYCLACSAFAGEAVYGKTACEQGLVHVIPNSITLEKYTYDPEMRDQMRREWQLQDKLVIGHVGRFHAAKNHGFLLEVFAEIKKLQQDAVLFLVGEGEGMDAAKQKASELGIMQDVVFAGKKTNVSDYYQMFDVLLFPSLYEGMPGSVLEAQAAGLPCLISDTITPEAGVTELVEYKCLQDGAQKWAESLTKLALKNTGVRTSHLDALRAAGFDVSDQAVKMMNFYEKEEPIW